MSDMEVEEVSFLPGKAKQDKENQKLYGAPEQPPPRKTSIAKVARKPSITKTQEPPKLSTEQLPVPDQDQEPAKQVIVNEKPEKPQPVPVEKKDPPKPKPKAEPVKKETKKKEPEKKTKPFIPPPGAAKEPPKPDPPKPKNPPAPPEQKKAEPGDTVHHKKSVYEPTRHQRCHQLICSRSWAITILVLLGMLLIIIASLAAFARPECQACSPTSEYCLNSQQPQKQVTTTPKPDFISKTGEEYPWKDVRLPSFVIPKSYKLIMHPNISKSEFHGEVNIELEVKKETDFMVFHASDINITNYSITSNDKTILVKKYLQYDTFEQFYLQLERKLQPGENLILSVNFIGELKPKLHGFYKSSYKTKAGEERHIAVTHFEPTDAREAFPCFDEPALKATFELSITRDSQHITLFNMPLKSSENQANGLIVDHYEISKRMSTYLVAFVVCDFGHVHKTTKDGVKVGVYAPQDMIYQADFALDAAVQILEYYNTFFGVPYPLPKQDLIAIPDFAAGAMENWGLITYRLSALLFDNKTSSLSSKQWVATVVAHELAHQWFGNLVTMKWWDDLWLNEGFASYVEYLGAAVVLPEFRMNDQFLLKDFQSGLNLDSLSTSHPIQVHVSNPDQINEIFDSISYSKGSSILRMLRFSLGEKEFKNGLSSYLKKYQFGNAETKDLWQSLQSESNLNVKDIMDTWTLQMGYPLVTVTRTDNTVILQQERYLFDKQLPQESEFTSPFNYKWYIPFSYVTDKSPSNKKTIWMNKTSVTLPFDSSSRWIKGNFGVNGFYRVDYGDIWNEIILQLRNNHQLFDEADRAGLLDDAYMLSRSDKVDVTTALDITQYLDKENDYIVWSTVASGQFSYLFSQLRYEESYSDLQSYVQKLINHLIKKVGWNDTGDILEKYLRTLILNLADKVGHKATIEEGKIQFKKWKENPESINQNLKSVILKIGIKYGDKEDWDFVWNRYNEIQVPSERDLLVRALTDTQDVHIINIYLKRALANSKITDIVISRLGGNHAARLHAWQFIKENWDILYKRYGQGSFTLSKIIKHTVTSFNTQYLHDQVKEFFDGKELGSATRAVKQVLESITSRITWMKQNSHKVGEWLKTNSS